MLKLETKETVISELDDFRVQARHWAMQLHTAYNWAAVLLQLCKLSQELRCEVWQIWQEDVFGDV